jgi:hypothetical protein
MEYSHIVVLIDEYLDRLQRVRQLLAPAQNPLKPIKQKTKKHLLKSSSVRTAVVQSPTTRLPEIPQNPSLPALHIIPPVNRRKSTRRKPAHPDLKTALSGNVSTAPIVVSAEQVRLQQQSQKKIVQETKLGSDHVETLSPHDLSRRWLRGLNSSSMDPSPSDSSLA